MGGVCLLFDLVILGDVINKTVMHWGPHCQTKELSYTRITIRFCISSNYLGQVISKPLPTFPKLLQPELLWPQIRAREYT